MKILFSANGWEDYCHWCANDRAVHLRINRLIEDISRRPFVGLGKPEPLKGDLSGWWCRRITGEHRIVYRVQGQAGETRHIEVAQCRTHY